MLLINWRFHKFVFIDIQFRTFGNKCHLAKFMYDYTKHAVHEKL